MTNGSPEADGDDSDYALQELPEGRSHAHTKRNINRAVEAVAGLLGNTPAICRKSYIHPAMLEAYTQGTSPRTRRPGAKLRSVASPIVDFQRMESAVVAWLQRLQRTTQKRSA